MENSCAKPDQFKLASVLWHSTRKAVEAFHNTSLPPHYLPHTVPDRSVCSAALQTLPPHPTPLQVSCAATLFQFRKELPGNTGVAAQQAAWMEAKTTLSQYPQPAHPAFRYAARRTVYELLGPGWDRTYRKNIGRCVPSLSASLDTVPGDPLFTHREFLEFVDGTATPELASQLLSHFKLATNPREFKALPDAGKIRPITKATMAALLLRPLHLTIQDALNRTGAIVVGPATPSVFKSFSIAAGEVFCSSDYKNATGNFNPRNSSHLLSLLHGLSELVPECVWELALRFMGPAETHLYRGSVLVDSFTALTGQRMGDLLSFPLLCLTNLTGVVNGLTPSVAFPLVKAGLVKINGDDLVFRTTPALIERWQALLPQSGLLLETTKTLKHGSVFTLNSTYFIARRVRVPRAIFFMRGNVLRSSPLRPLKKSDGPAWANHRRGILPRFLSRVNEATRWYPQQDRVARTVQSLCQDVLRRRHTKDMAADPYDPAPPLSLLPSWLRSHVTTGRKCRKGFSISCDVPGMRMPPGFRRSRDRPVSELGLGIHALASSWSAWYRSSADAPSSIGCPPLAPKLYLGTPAQRPVATKRPFSSQWPKFRSTRLVPWKTLLDNHMPGLKVASLGKYVVLPHRTSFASKTFPMWFVPDWGPEPKNPVKFRNYLSPGEIPGPRHTLSGGLLAHGAGVG